MYAQLPAFLQEAETELELAVKIEAFYRSLGHPGVVPMRAFNAEFVYGHILAGASGSAASASAGPTGGRGLGPFFSQGAGRSRIHPGEPVLIDYSPSVKGYLCDQCRVFSMGKLPRELVDAHQVMLEIQDAIAVKGKPGAQTAELYELALRKVERAGLSRGFMGHPEPVSFVGHGLGLELDEWPVVSGKFPHPLKAGMILALEPKYVSPGQGVVGIENTFLVTDRGMEKLNAFPDDIHIL
jgi:Xaa-Pro aminopeptidase